MGDESLVKVWLAVDDSPEETNVYVHQTREGALRGLVEQISEAEWKTFVRSLGKGEVRGDERPPRLDGTEDEAVLEWWFGESRSEDGGRFTAWGENSLNSLVVRLVTVPR